MRSFEAPSGSCAADDQIALVLVRQESGRHARQRPDCDADQNEREDHHRAAATRHRADQPHVAALREPIDGVEAAVKEVALFERRRRSQPQRALRRLQGRRVDGADEGCGGDDERKLPIELSGQSRQEGGGDEHRHQHQRDADDRTYQLVHRLLCGLAARHALLDIARDAFDDDDRVVDDDADRQHDGEQRREIDRKAKRRHRSEGADDRHRNGRRRNEHRAPILQENENDDQHQNAGLDQCPIHLVDRSSHEFRGVVGRQVAEARREAFGELVHFRFDCVGDRDGVGVRQQRDGDPGGRPAVQGKRLAVSLRAELDAADVADSGDLSAICGIDLDDDVPDLGGIVQAAFEVERILKILAFRRRRRADLAGGDFLALLLYDVDDVLRRQASRLKQVRIHPNPHGVLPGAEDLHGADAVEASQFVLHADDGVVRQEQAVEAAVGRNQRDEFENRGRLLRRRHPLNLHFLRQRRNGGRHLVLHQDLRLVGVRADREGDDQGIGAVVRARRLHINHVLDAVDLLLDRQGDGVDEGLGARAGVARRHLYGGRDDIGILGARQLDEGDQADQDEYQRDHVGEHRPFDEKARNHGRSPRGFISPPGPPRPAPRRPAADRPWRRERPAESPRSLPSRPGRVRIR